MNVPLGPRVWIEILRTIFKTKIDLKYEIYKRLAFARNYVSWGFVQLAKVLFSDESTVQQFTDRHRHVWRP